MSKKLDQLNAAEKEHNEKVCTDDYAHEYLQTFPIKLLVAVANGEIDLNNLVKAELGYRGLDLKGQWVGIK